MGDCINSFLDWGIFDAKIFEHRTFEMIPFIFMTVYTIRYHKEYFFRDYPKNEESEQNLINRARKLGVQFDLMVYVFQNDRSRELYQTHITFSEQIKILSKPLIGKKFKERVKTFGDDLADYHSIVRLRE